MQTLKPVKRSAMEKNYSINDRFSAYGIVREVIKTTYQLLPFCNSRDGPQGD
jgi:hypothetical protein